MKDAWRRVPAWARWPLAYLALVALALAVGALGVGFGNALFLLGAAAILVSVGFVGFGGESRFRLVRDLFGRPVAVQARDPEERRREISTGMKVFLLGLALWAPLVALVLRS